MPASAPATALTVPSPPIAATTSQSSAARRAASAEIAAGRSRARTTSAPASRNARSTGATGSSPPPAPGLPITATRVRRTPSRDRHGGDGSRARRALERERAAQGLGALAQRGQADVARAHASPWPRPGSKPTPSSRTCTRSTSRFVPQRDRDARGARVPDDVGEQLARAAQHGAVVRARLALREVELELEARRARPRRGRSARSRPRGPACSSRYGWRSETAPRSSATVAVMAACARASGPAGSALAARSRSWRAASRFWIGPSCSSCASCLRSRSSAVSASATRRWRCAESSRTAASRRARSSESSASARPSQAR